MVREAEPLFQISSPSPWQGEGDTGDRVDELLLRCCNSVSQNLRQCNSKATFLREFQPSFLNNPIITGGLLLPIVKYGCYNWYIMKIRREEVLHIALLARLGVTETEVNRLSEQLSNILENFEVLQQVDTTDVPPTTQSIALQNVVSDDKVADSLPQSQVLANAPRKEEGFFRVKAVLE